jgi:Na+-translocating ferredoxin:NAD+ oxidoreductase RnfE subunit
MKDKCSKEEDKLIVDELLTFHQEKRTALAMIRIGIATLITQISIVSFLIATSKYYQWMEVMHLMIPLILHNLIVFGIAGYLIL